MHFKNEVKPPHRREISALKHHAHSKNKTEYTPQKERQILEACPKLCGQWMSSLLHHRPTKRSDTTCTQNKNYRTILNIYFLNKDFLKQLIFKDCQSHPNFIRKDYKKYKKINKYTFFTESVFVVAATLIKEQKFKTTATPHSERVYCDTKPKKSHPLANKGVNLHLKDTTEVVCLVEFMYLVFIHMPGESYCRQLRSLICVCVTSFKPFFVDSAQALWASFCFRLFILSSIIIIRRTAD